MRSSAYQGLNKYEIAQYNATRSNKNDKITAGSQMGILRNSQSSRKTPYTPNQYNNDNMSSGVSRFSPYGRGTEDQQYTPSGSEQNHRE